MYKSCSRCGKIHDAGYQCNAHKIYLGGIERELRSNYKWTQKSLEIREKAQYLCEVCRDSGIYTYDSLEVHHINKLREDKDNYLSNDNLICLCTECHKKADRGEISKEYLRKLARRREEAEE